MHKDRPALEALSSILGSGGSSRLYKKMIKKKHAARSVGSWMTTYPMTNLFIFNASPQYPHTCAEMEKMILEEVAAIKKNGVTERELQRVKNMTSAGFVRVLKSNSHLAHNIGFHETFSGGWDYFMTYRKSHLKLTPADIQRVAKKYFSKKNYTVIMVPQKKKPKAKVNK